MKISRNCSAPSLLGLNLVTVLKTSGWYHSTSVCVLLRCQIDATQLQQITIKSSCVVSVWAGLCTRVPHRDRAHWVQQWSPEWAHGPDNNLDWSWRWDTKSSDRWSLALTRDGRIIYFHSYKSSAAFRPVSNKGLPSRSKVVQDNHAT